MACKCPVAPRAGAWIETVFAEERIRDEDKSPPVRGRGLKLSRTAYLAPIKKVAPRAGAWIETLSNEDFNNCLPSRPPCGGVD